jgi:hypothetical protein
MGGVIEEASREGEVVGSIPYRKYCAKNTAPWDFDIDGQGLP